jgi:hypothetical protein
MARLKPVVHAVAVFLAFGSLLGLAGCFGSSVKNLLITSVKLTPANPTIAVGVTQQFVLSATFADLNTDAEPPSETAWFSDDETVATIDHMGIATALAAGTTHIKGSYKGNNTTTLLTVTAAAAAMSAVEGSSRVLHVTNLRTGQQMTFAANAMRDLVTVSRDGARAGGISTESVASGAREMEVSVAPEHGPTWIAVDPAAKYLYVVNQTSESVSAFAIDWKTGALNPVVMSPFSAGAKPLSVEVDPDGTGLSISHLENSEVSRFAIDPATGALTPDQR